MVGSNAQQVGRWYAACLYAGFHGWAVVRDVAQPGTRPGGPGLYQMDAAPGAYLTYEQAQAAAEQSNSGLLPQPTTAIIH